ncbi:hypothetical protein U9M48_024220 [Paspalum notatum var. saurae]|uniref:Uncharacterized protein n=1 Tax=Paspalum notatum var. saurae TaxID=547442 RepID=A0AAQ3TN62_PASNO
MAKTVGTPSPILFNVVVDMLAIILTRAKYNGQICGQKNVSHCTPTCLDARLENWKGNMLSYGGKLLPLFMISFFEIPRVILKKIDYFSIPMHFRKLTNKDWKPIEDRIEKKLSNWKGNMLSYGGKLLPLFMISFFEIPRVILKKIDYFRSRLFWQNDNHKKKYTLIRWPLICFLKIKVVWS